MKVLLTSADSTLGQTLESLLLQTGRHEVEALTSAECRWKSERQVKKSLRRSKCDLLVDLRLQAALDGGVQIHDADLDRSHWLAKACQRDKVSYVYVSSARVYSGEIERLYAEDDYPDSEETIGELLLSAEEAVRDACERHLILRLGPVFSARGMNVLTHMLGKLVQGGTLTLDNHLRGAPVWAGDGARVVAALIDQLSTGIEPWGIYHYSSSDSTNCYEFAEALLASASQFSEFGASAVQLEKHTESTVQLSRAFDCGKIRDTFAVMQVPWRGFVAGAVKQYFQRTNN